MKCTLYAEENRVERGQRISIEEMIDNVEFLKYTEGVEIFKITESFLKRGKVSYLLRYLQIEQEEGIMICSDLDNILQDSVHTLSVLLKKSIQKVYRIYAQNEDEEFDYFKLYFGDGYIEIRPLLC